MKATANGALNVSVLDGWWCEGYSPGAGWAIGRGEEYQDENYQDDVESHALFNLLEKEVVPLFYERGPDGHPRGWTDMMKRAMKSIGPVFSSNRMVAEYAESFYLPGHERSATLAASQGTRAKGLAAWKRNVRQAWPGVHVLAIEDDQKGDIEVGNTFSVRASVALNGLSPDFVRVELFHGRLDSAGDIRTAQTVRMQPAGPGSDGSHQFVGRVVAVAAGRQGYTVRVLPSHEDLAHPIDTGLVVWA
jgi:starch phosphorylase